MKYYRLALIGLFTFFCFSLNAQFFVGGNFDLSTTGGKTDNGTTTTDKTSTLQLDVLPKVGFFLSDKAALGLALDISYLHTRTPAVNETLYHQSSIGIIPFLRYYAIKMNKFSVFGQGNIELLFSGSRTKVGGTSSDGPKTTRFSLNVFPGLAYDLNEKISFETTLNVLSFGYYNSTVKNGSVTDKNSSFNFGAGIDNIISVGSVTIGAIYKF